MEKQNVSFKKFNQLDVVKFYTDVVYKWEPASEVWAFKHGDDLTTGSVAVTGMYFTRYFRKELKLRSFSRLTCYMPVVGLASLGAFVCHSRYVSSDILSRDKCPLCITTKASVLQLAVGLVYPLVIAPVVTFFVADKLLTYPIPSVSRAPKEVFNLWLKLIKKNPRPIFIAAVAQVLITSVVVQQKMSFVYSNWP